MVKIADKPKIVILDDEQDIVEVYAEILGLKYDVVSFTQTDDYMAFLKNCKSGHEKLHDLLITDYNLGQRLNGLDVIEETRKLNKLIPFILISGYFIHSATSKPDEYGAHCVLEKPLDYQKLDATISSLLVKS